jgi:uncharacterized protein
MLLDLSRFRAGSERLERTFEPPALARPDDLFKIASPVALTAELQKDGQKVRLAGRVRGTLELECSRCLEPYPVQVDSSFDLMFLPDAETAATSDGDERGEREVREDDLGVSYYRDDQIDLAEVIREQFYLALPMKPLCKEECQGLCPVCGINRNRETCTCQHEWVDPRMEPLKRLKQTDRKD